MVQLSVGPVDGWVSQNCLNSLLKKTFQYGANTIPVSELTNPIQTHFQQDGRISQTGRGLTPGDSKQHVSGLVDDLWQEIGPEIGHEETAGDCVNTTLR